MFDFNKPPQLPIRKRGAVGIMTDNDEAWLGVYINDGSNPITFGSQLWWMLQENWKCLERWGKSLLECGYWEEFQNGGLCPYCGKFGVGQPHRVKGSVIHLYESKGPKSIAPDPHCNGHSHLPTMPTVVSTNEMTDGMWVEWAYVLDPKTYNLTIHRSVRCGGTFEARQGGRKWDQPKFKYFQLDTFNLHGYEPDWENLEKRGLAASFYYHQKYTENPCGEIPHAPEV